MGMDLDKLMESYGVDLDASVKVARKRIYALYELNFELMMLYPEDARYKKNERELERIGKYLVKISVVVPESKGLALSDTSWVEYFKENELTKGASYDILDDIDGNGIDDLGDGC